MSQFPELDEEFNSVKKLVEEVGPSQTDKEGFHSELVRLYARVDLLLLDYQEKYVNAALKSDQEKEPKKENEANENNKEKNEDKKENHEPKSRHEKIKEILEQFRTTKLCTEINELKKKLQIPDHHKTTPEAVFRTIALFFAVFLVGPIILMLTPLRLLHPTLRRQGVKYLPLDVLQVGFCKLITKISGVDIKVEGLEDLKDSRPKVFMYNHLSNLDPFILGGSNPVFSKMIAKKSLFWIPVLGWLAWGVGTIPIDRGNLQKAIKSMKKAAAIMKRWSRSICVSPEGTRSKTGQLLEFKKGPFHLATEVVREIPDLKIVPVLLFGPFEICPPKTPFPQPGGVTIRFLEPFSVPTDMEIDEMSVIVRRRMLNGLKNAPDQVGKRHGHKDSDWVGLFLVGVVYAVVAYLFTSWLL